MKNCERFKTVDERANAFHEYCKYQICKECYNVDPALGVKCLLKWLDADEKILPCPFCGSNEIVSQDVGGCQLECYRCGYKTKISINESLAIAAHNRVARAVQEREKEN